VLGAWWPVVLAWIVRIAFQASLGASWKPPGVAFFATSSVQEFLAHLTVVRSFFRAVLSFSWSWAHSEFFEYSLYALSRLSMHDSSIFSLRENQSIRFFPCLGIVSHAAFLCA
jgi:hypothetical protein